MRPIFYFFLSLIVISCSSETEQEVMPKENDALETKGMQAFSIDFKEITAKNSLNKNSKNLEPAFAFISITEDDGNVVYTRKKFSLNKVDEKYVTEEITLDAGTYSLTEFIVTDADNVVISLVPMENSALAQLTETTLPFGFTVMTDETNITYTENIEADGFAAFDFGYGEINLVFAEATEFFSLAVDESELLTTKTIVLKSLTGSNYKIDWGDGVIDEYISTKTDVEEGNKLTHIYNQQDSYSIIISGPIEVIEYFSFTGEDPNEIYQYQSNLVSIDIGKLALLKGLDIYTGKLSNLDISENIYLETLLVRDNELTSIDLSNNPNLKKVRVDNNALTNIDVSQNLNLESLAVDQNQLENLDVTNNTRLQYLSAHKNELSSLNISNNLGLTVVNVGSNLLTTLDISNNVNLILFSVGFNELTEVDVSKNTNLKSIDLNNNQISSIDLSNNLKLESLDINDNLLSEIDLSNNSELRTLIIANNMLSNLDISQNPWIYLFNIRGNQFSNTQLDQIITQVYDHVVLYSIMEGYISFNNNPGFNGVNAGTMAKIDELENTFNWNYNEP